MKNAYTNYFKNGLINRSLDFGTIKLQETINNPKTLYSSWDSFANSNFNNISKVQKSVCQSLSRKSRARPRSSYGTKEYMSQLKIRCSDISKERLEIQKIVQSMTNKLAKISGIQSD